MAPRCVVDDFGDVVGDEEFREIGVTQRGDDVERIHAALVDEAFVETGNLPLNEAKVDVRDSVPFGEVFDGRDCALGAHLEIRLRS